MSDPGLNQRLSQRSRRAGLMIGLSMIVTVAFCAIAFTVIYTALDGFTTDFVSGSDETPTIVAQGAGDQNPVQPEDPADVADIADLVEEEESQPDPNSDDSLPTPTPPTDEAEDEDGFDPDYQTGGERINLREGPSTATSIVATLDPSTPLLYLDEEAPTDSSVDGDRWMRFQTEDGQEGWMREIDTTEFQE